MKRKVVILIDEMADAALNLADHRELLKHAMLIEEVVHKEMTIVIVHMMNEIEEENVIEREIEREIATGNVNERGTGTEIIATEKKFWVADEVREADQIV